MWTSCLYIIFLKNSKHAEKLENGLQKLSAVAMLIYTKENWSFLTPKGIEEVATMRLW